MLVSYVSVCRRVAVMAGSDSGLKKHQPTLNGPNHQNSGWVSLACMWSACIHGVISRKAGATHSKGGQIDTFCANANFADVRLEVLSLPGHCFLLLHRHTDGVRSLLFLPKKRQNSFQNRVSPRRSLTLRMDVKRTWHPYCLSGSMIFSERNPRYC